MWHLCCTSQTRRDNGAIDLIQSFPPSIGQWEILQATHSLWQNPWVSNVIVVVAQAPHMVVFFFFVCRQVSGRPVNDPMGERSANVPWEWATVIPMEAAKSIWPER